MVETKILRSIGIFAEDIKQREDIYLVCEVEKDGFRIFISEKYHGGRRMCSEFLEYRAVDFMNESIQIVLERYIKKFIDSRDRNDKRHV